MSMNMKLLADYIRTWRPYLSPDWGVYQIESVGKAEPILCVTGAVAPFKKRKPAERYWRKMDRATIVREVVYPDDYQEWLEVRGRRLGRCPDCDGMGTVSVGWSKETGVRREKCARCDGTGTYREAEHNEP